MNASIRIGHVATCQLAMHIPRVVYFHVIQTQSNRYSIFSRNDKNYTVKERLFGSLVGTLMSYKRN